MSKYFCFTITFLFCTLLLSAQSSSISGTIYSQETNKAIINSNVKLYLENALITQKHTDQKGNYKFKNLGSGSFTIQANASGYKSTFDICKISLNDQKQILNFKLESPKDLNPSLQGIITNQETGEAVGFTTVAIYQNGILISGLESDKDGYYSFEYIEPGVYHIETFLIGYMNSKEMNVIIKEGEINTVNLTISESYLLADSIEVIHCGIPLIIKDESNKGHNVTKEEIKNLPKRNINGLESTKAVCGSSDSQLFTDHMTPREKRKQKRRRARAEKKKGERED